jgi:carboxylesterase
MPEIPGLDINAFRHEGSGAGCLMIHGFCGTPTEFSSLGRHLAESGWTVDCPQLDGHGTSPDDLMGVTREDWRATVLKHYQLLRSQHGTVVVFGLSMGALLALDLAAQQAVDGLVLMAPALIVRDKLIHFLPIARFFLGHIEMPTLPRGGLVGEDGWQRLWHYEKRPASAIYELWKLQREVKPRLKSVGCPTLILHGLQDLTVPPVSAQAVYDGIASTEKRIVWLDRSGHCLTVDLDESCVIEESRNFVEHVSQSQVNQPGPTGE